MKRVRHGARLTLEELEAADATGGVVDARVGAPFNGKELTCFGYMLEDLQRDEQALLPESPSTVALLTRLGESMFDVGGGALDSGIPSVYTYFGQFVNHEITFERESARLADLASPNLAPLPLTMVTEMIKNSRSASLDLDSIYDKPAPRKGNHMVLGPVSPSRSIFRRPDFKDNLNDLPRAPRSRNPLGDRQALIGDPRNDENLIIAQLHVAFLRAHNALVDQGNTFDQAATLLRQHFQWVVIHDFLMQVADTEIVGRTLDQNRFYDALTEPFFLPLEFTVGAFRFGHSMVRSSYDFNVNFNGQGAATLGQLFTFTALGGNIGPEAGSEFATLPEHWIIEWEGFLPGGTNKARRLDTRLVEPLFALRNEVGGPLSGDVRLAVRNLLRGYLLRMPTGQAVAKSLGLDALTEDLLNGVPSKQHQLLFDSGFLNRTPLWFYILAEANHPHLGKGNRLGPVGSTLVAEVLIGLVRRSKDSILLKPGWTPTLRGDGSFTLADLLRLGGVLSPETP